MQRLLHNDLADHASACAGRADKTIDEMLMAYMSMSASCMCGDTRDIQLTLVGLAVVAVCAGGGQLHAVGLAGGVHQVILGDGISVHASLQVEATEASEAR